MRGDEGTSDAASAMVPVTVDGMPPSFHPSLGSTFGSFLQHLRHSGLSIVRQYDSASLLNFAVQSVVLEEKLATCVFLVQCVTLVEHYHRTCCSSSSSSSSSSGDSGDSGTDMEAQAFVRNFYMQRRQHAHSTTRYDDESAWRAKFAVQLHSILHLPEFERLQPWLVQTPITTLRTLHRAWHLRHLSFFGSLLVHVITERLGNSIVAKSIQSWTRDAVEAELDAHGEQGLLQQFRIATRKECDQRHVSRTRRTVAVSERGLSPFSAPAAASASAAAAAGPEAATPFPSILMACASTLVQQPQALLTVEVFMNDYEPRRDGSSHTHPPAATAKVANSSSAAGATLRRPDCTVDTLCQLEQLRQPCFTVDASIHTLLAATIDDKQHPASDHGSDDNDDEPEVKGRPVMVEEKRTALRAESNQSRTQAEKRKRSHSPEVSSSRAASPNKRREKKKKKQQTQETTDAQSSEPGRARDDAEAAQDEEEQVTTAPPACLPACSRLPVEIVRLGIKKWAQQRVHQSSDVRASMDGALVDFMLELVDNMSEGAILEVRQFKQARRSQSRDVASAHSSRMEPERTCQLLEDMLDRLVQ